MYNRFMHIIDRRKLIPISNISFYVLPIGTLFVLSAIVSFFSWQHANNAVTSETSAIMNKIVEEEKDSISKRLDTARLVLAGASGLFTSNESVTNDEWNRFINSFGINKTHPGIKAMGYLTLTTPENVPDVIQSIHKGTNPETNFHPLFVDKQVALITYIFPSNPASLGYNMFSHPSRKEALSRAATNNSAELSDRIIYDNAVMPFHGTGFSMYYPVYFNNVKTTKAQSKRKVRGYVFAAFLADTFFKKALSVNKNEFALRVYDGGTIDYNNLLYQTNNFNKFSDNMPLSVTTKQDLLGQEWTLEFLFSNNIISQSARNNPLNVAIMGVIFSLFLPGLVLMLLITRSKVLANNKQVEIQLAKDELLSLASHQLRTPATTVKQYIGMILEGFSGSITKQQKMLLRKAYDSNERQLNIINDMLYVAKIDAKGIILSPKRIDMNKLLKELIKEHRLIAKKDNQKIKLVVPKKPTYLRVDEHNLRMAIENIVSNALKYSPDSSTVTVRLTVDYDNSTVRIAISDRGIGIKESDLHMLFQRFSRVSNELTNQTHGSGIGLYISHKLVQLHGGSIEVSSVKGKGSTFTIVLPKKYNFDSAPAEK